MNEFKKTPPIRFKEFSDDWEQRLLKKIADKVSEKNTELNVSETFTNSAEFGVISQRDFFDHDISNIKNIGTYYVVKENDFVYNPRISVTAPFGPINCNKLGRVGVMSPLYTVFRTHDVDTTYLEWFFKSAYWHKFMYSNGDSGARYDRFSIKDSTFFEMPISYPQIEEQKQIGRFMEQIEKLVTLHQDRYERLNGVLLSMRDKLFARMDTPCPENRFSGFEGEWEIRRLGDIISPYTDPVPTPHDGYERLGIRSHGKGTFYSHVDAGAELETAQMHRVAAGKMIVNITFAWEHAVAVTDENDAGKLVSHRFPQFTLSEELHPRFLHYLILDERFRHHLFLASPGGAGRNRVLKIDEMLEYKVRVPKYGEQEKIASFLDSLEELTQLYATRVEKLKNIKAACLEGMFI